MGKFRSAKTLLAGALLSGLSACASNLGRPLSAALDRSQAACLAAFDAADRRVARAGVGDADSARVAGFPYLRVDRLLASFAAHPLDPQQRSAWLARLAALDADGRRVEMAALGAPTVALDECRRQLVASLATNDSAWAALLRAATVPDDYRPLQRVLGLYPLAAPLARRGIARLQNTEQPQPRVEIPPNGLVYAAPESPLEPLDLTPALANARLDPLGFPALAAPVLAALFAQHAPVWVVASASADDVIGTIVRSTADTPVVAAPPSVYQYTSYTRFEARVLLQLNYVVWFPARPAVGMLDTLAGKFDGLIWRVTLDTDGAPLAFDTLHNCGCYHLWFPTARLRLRAVDPADGEALWVPFSLVPAPRIGVQLAAGTHFVRGVGPAPAHPAIPLQVRDYTALRALPAPSGQPRSLFAPDGLLPGSQRAERYLLWPLGVPSAGAMRQRGHHATAFVGIRHFDEAYLLARYFTRAAPLQGPAAR